MRQKWFWNIFLLMLTGCVEPYRPSIPITSINVLVIDGFVNASDSTIQVILSRAVSVTSNDSSYAESAAQVSVVDDVGSVYLLSEGNPGYYSGKAFISSSNKFKLNVITLDQKKYSSDYIDILETPPIDSVYYSTSPAGIAIYVDAHDDNNATRYYRWTFDETWKYRVPYLAYKEIINGKLTPIDPSASKTICYISGPSSTSILVYSTEALKQNVVNKFQVTFLPKGIQKISDRYSINVHQRAISANLYNYWIQLQSNSQNSGSLYDVLPTQVVGNVHSDTDPSETVLGYFSGSTVTDKRIFIDTLDLPLYLQRFPPYYNCKPDSIPLDKMDTVPEGTLFYSSYGIGIVGYLTTDKHCMDCTLSGGTITPPNFWKKR
jgi:hypothetical protein